MVIVKLNAVLFFSTLLINISIIIKKLINI